MGVLVYAKGEVKKNISKAPTIVKFEITDLCIKKLFLTKKYPVTENKLRSGKKIF